MTRIKRVVKRRRASAKKKKPGYDVSFRATGVRLESKSARNAKFNR